MQFVANANPPDPAPGCQRDFHFLIEPEPWPRVFLRNLGDLFRPSPPQVWMTSRPGEYWADALVNRPVAWAAMSKSFLGHGLALAAIYGLTLLWMHQPHIIADKLPPIHRLNHYELSEYLPGVNSRPEQERPKPPVRRVAQEADPEYAPQEIVSVNENPDSIRQTIVNPAAPKLLAQDTPLPNIVAWTPVPSTAPVAPRHALNQPLPLAAPVVVPPAQEVTRRNLNALQLPVLQQQAVAPSAQPVARDLSVLNMPAQSQAAVPPAPSTAQRNLGDINIALNAPTVEAPKLPTPEQQVGNGQEQGQAASAAPSVPPSAPVTAGTGKSQAQAVGQLLALNVQPVAPTSPLTVPEGNRRGEFAAGPGGRPGATARPEIAAADTKSPAGNPSGSNSSFPANIYVAAPPKKIASDVVVAAPLPRPDTHSTDATGAPDVPSGKIEDRVFAGRKYYSMALNMPNFTSSGGSWIMRFAELNPTPGTVEGVSAPVAVSKVDPAYPAALMRDKVEGTVVLRAVIKSDGSVGEIRVLQGLNDTLDENAEAALQKWHFRPGTKNGAPVDLEAVIKIPFRAPKTVF
ncbi:MAG: hypothetical protein DMG65_08430 [Candidatus Angelobacter sp. Gp1-AA117]|nr:MAG: hypothetical protein DMG65_08430 [Candidatus Angelobacter sp. Gp1-AA117]